MMCSNRTLSRALFACVFFVSLTSGLRAQGTNTPGTIDWPANPPVGIGTQMSAPFNPVNALQIHHDPAHLTMPAILRLSDGGTDTSNYFGGLALMPDSSPAFYSAWSNLATLYDLVLHEHHGDLILANYDQWGGAIRFSTTPVPTIVPTGTPPNDLERMSITQDGNVGIDLPPSQWSGLDSAADQVQIGGGILPGDGLGFPVPGLTIYGGNRFEEMPKPGGGFYPFDWRYISFNRWIDHSDTSSYREHRFQPIGSSAVSFAGGTGGMIDLACLPFDSSRGMNDFSHEVEIHLTGDNGLEMWSDEGPADPFHHLFDVWRPGHHYSSMDSIRNDNGLFIHYTPVYIGDSIQNWQVPNFTDFTHVHPGIGDGKTWMLAVNGAALFKEAWVNSADWPDYVFLRGYHLMSIDDFGTYLKANHHLPDLPPAKTMETTGIPLGQTQAALTKQVEELSLYIVQLHTELTALKAEVQDLKKGGK